VLKVLRCTRTLRSAQSFKVYKNFEGGVWWLYLKNVVKGRQKNCVLSVGKRCIIFYKVDS